MAGGAAGLGEADLREPRRRRRARELLPAPAAVRRTPDLAHGRDEGEPLLPGLHPGLDDDRPDRIVDARLALARVDVLRSLVRGRSGADGDAVQPWPFRVAVHVGRDAVGGDAIR